LNRYYRPSLTRMDPWPHFTEDRYAAVNRLEVIHDFG